ncbi:hypothetical protein GCM10009848_40930 [Micromonospora lupini]
MLFLVRRDAPVRAQHQRHVARRAGPPQHRADDDLGSDLPQRVHEQGQRRVRHGEHLLRQHDDPRPTGGQARDPRAVPGEQVPAGRFVDREPVLGLPQGDKAHGQRLGRVRGTTQRPGRPPAGADQESEQTGGGGAQAVPPTDAGRPCAAEQGGEGDRDGEQQVGDAPDAGEGGQLDDLSHVGLRVGEAPPRTVREQVRRRVLAQHPQCRHGEDCAHGSPPQQQGAGEQDRAGRQAETEDEHTGDRGDR